MASAEKQAYDKAAEAFCDHVLACPNCTMKGPHCEEGDALLLVENETWVRYRERRIFDEVITNNPNMR